MLRTVAELDDCSLSTSRLARARILAAELRRIEDLERQLLISRARVKTLVAEILAESEPERSGPRLCAGTDRRGRSDCGEPQMHEAHPLGVAAMTAEILAEGVESGPESTSADIGWHPCKPWHIIVDAPTVSPFASRVPHVT